MDKMDDKLLLVVFQMELTLIYSSISFISKSLKP